MTFLNYFRLSNLTDRAKLQYAAIKGAYLSECGYDVPVIYRSAFVHWGGSAEVQFIFRKFLDAVPRAGAVLIIGVMGGRDYFLCKNMGFNVTALDLGPQPAIAPIVSCNAEDGLPFADQTFDAAIVAEVLEHLADDVRVIRDLRRVLKPSGNLLVSIPYYNDWEEGHVRIHSPWSAKRLLEICGFRVQDYLERPGMLFPGRLNWIIHAASLISYKLRGRTLYRATTEAVGRLEYTLGHIFWLRRIRRLSKHFGGYYRCTKADSLDYVKLNASLYTTR
jgi:SAM-dependent methyltransferase